MSDAKKKQLTNEEIDKLVTEAFPTPNLMCPGLCAELQDILDTLADPDLPPEVKKQLLIKLHAISAQIRQLHCRCRPQ